MAAKRARTILPIERPEAHIADTAAEVRSQAAAQAHYVELRPSDLVALRDLKKLLLIDLDGVSIFIGYQGDGE